MIDHGEILVHDMKHEPLHYVHDISVRNGEQPPESYSYEYGWTRCETPECPHPGLNGACRRKGHVLIHYNLYCKTRPAR